ncbi:unnamed protein product [Discula destructiva]
MAPVPVEPKMNYTGVTLVALHLLGVVFCVQRVASSLHHARNTLPVSQHVKDRTVMRKQLGWLFCSLALLSLTLAATTGLQYAALSFEHWAHERGVGSNPSAFQGVPLNASTSHDLAANLGGDFFLDRLRWLGDTPIYQDAFEIIAEKARRFWWGQQIELALVSWSVFVAVEGHRRGIVNLFSFMALAHLVNLSFAQSAFYVAMVLTPVPLPEDALRPTRWNCIRNYLSPLKPRNWCLKPGYILLSVMLSYATIYVLPHVAGSPSFGRIIVLSRALTFVPLLLQTTAPPWMGVVLPQKRTVDPAFTDLFRFMAVVGCALHARALLLGLTYNMPHAQYHRHSKILPWDIEERSRWERTTTSLGKLLGALRDHTVIAGAGYDVLLSSLSIGLWAALRPLAAGDVLAAVVPLYNRAEEGTKTTDLVYADEDQDNDADPSLRRGVSKRGITSNPKSVGKAATSITEETPGPRRRGRPRKAKADPVVMEEEPDDKTYQPTTQEEATDPVADASTQGVDTEAAALVWGLIAVGGLALGSAGGLGGEMLVR